MNAPLKDPMTIPAPIPGIPTAGAQRAGNKVRSMLNEHRFVNVAPKRTDGAHVNVGAHRPYEFDAQNRALEQLEAEVTASRATRRCTTVKTTTATSTPRCCAVTAVNSSPSRTCLIPWRPHYQRRIYSSARKATREEALALARKYAARHSYRVAADEGVAL